MLRKADSKFDSEGFLDAQGYGDRFLFQNTVNAQLNRILTAKMEAYKNLDVPSIDSYEGSLQGLEEILWNYIETEKVLTMFIGGRKYEGNYSDIRKHILESKDSSSLPTLNRISRLEYLNTLRNWNILIVSFLLPYVGLLPAQRKSLTTPDLSREHYERVLEEPETVPEEESVPDD